MPPASKSSMKKSGAPKTKGANRAKSGCYTCRVRRKKCDEKRNDKGYCGTCDRLRLECLGFGAKRPDFLKDARTVFNIRERIKSFLASQGMIKGHSASGPRTSDQDFLRLRYFDDCSSDSSASPPTSAFAISEDTHSHLTMSNIRGEPLFYPAYEAPNPELSPDDPTYGSSRASYNNDVMLSALPIPSSSNSIVSSPPSSGQPETYILTPATRSTLAPSYNYRIGSTDEEVYDTSIATIDTNDYIPIPLMSVETNGDPLFFYYEAHVVGLQYLLADNVTRKMMLLTTESDNYLPNAICLLTDVHRHRLNKQPPYSAFEKRYRLITPVLNKRCDSVDHAMAALHTVSTFLFAGGRGPWADWLQLAYDFADSQFRGPVFSPAYTLLSCPDERISFILRTSMWFDVIAAVTLCRPPHFMPEYRDLFSPAVGAYMDSPLGPVPDALSMMPIMGCENRVVLALAEVSELACWKEEQVRKGCLSIPQLSEKGEAIERHLLPAMGPDEPYLNDIKVQRRFTSEIFRSSTRVYLHSVISGDFPQCPEIKQGVAETISWLRKVPDNQNQPGESGRSVVRSVVLSIFLCGCLTDDNGQRQYLLRRLQEQDNETVGNCDMVAILMLKVWKKRKWANAEEPVRWREELRATGLLLV